MKKILSTLSIIALTGCSANYENYYLNDYSIEGNLQSKTTSELAFKNVVYAKVLENDESVEQFGPNGDDYTVIFFKAENISDDVSYFNFENSIIDNAETGRIKTHVNISKLIKSKSIDLDDEDTYMNPFKKTEMEDNNFAYNINNKVIKNFSLQPNEVKKGFLIFNKLKEPSQLQFTLSSGVSIYTSRVQTIKLDK